MNTFKNKILSIIENDDCIVIDSDPIYPEKIASFDNLSSWKENKDDGDYPLKFYSITRNSRKVDIAWVSNSLARSEGIGIVESLGIGMNEHGDIGYLLNIYMKDGLKSYWCSRDSETYGEYISQLKPGDCIQASTAGNSILFSFKIYCFADGRPDKFSGVSGSYVAKYKGSNSLGSTTPGIWGTSDLRLGTIYGTITDLYDGYIEVMPFGGSDFNLLKSGSLTLYEVSKDGDIYNGYSYIINTW